MKMHQSAGKHKMISVRGWEIGIVDTKAKTSIIMLMFASLILVSQPLQAFSIPERLEFEITYAGIPAGRAVQEVTKEGGEVHIISTARSAAWLKFIFPVDDRIETVLIEGTPPLNLGVPRLYAFSERGDL